MRELLACATIPFTQDSVCKSNSSSSWYSSESLPVKGCRIREEPTQALADGRGVTAKVRWVSKHGTEGRKRWIHCTPLIGSNGSIGVWMVVLVDDESQDNGRRFKQA